MLVLVGLRDRSALAGFEIGIGVWLMLVLIVRTVAAAVDRVGARSRLEHWVLLYKPERPAGWIFRGLFYITLTFTLLIAPVLVSMVRVDRDSAGVLLGFGAFATIPLFLRYLVFLLDANVSQTASRNGSCSTGQLPSAAGFFAFCFT